MILLAGEDSEDRIGEYEDLILKLDKRLADGEISEKTHNKSVKRLERLIEKEKEKGEVEIEEELVEEEPEEEAEEELGEEEEAEEGELEVEVEKKQGELSVFPLDDEVKTMLMFVTVGLVVGFVNGLTGLGGKQGGLLALAFFVISFRLPQMVMDPLTSSFEFSVWSILKTAGMPYWFLMLMAWTAVYTLSF